MRRSLSRRLIGLIGVSLFCEISYALVTTFALPLYLHNSLGWLEKQVGPVLSAFLLAETVAKPGWGVLSDRFGRKPLIIVGILISASAVVAMTAANSPWMTGALGPAASGLSSALGWLIGALHLPLENPSIPASHLAFLGLSALNGVGGAALWPNVFASVGDVTTDEERVGAMSVFNMMYMIGLGGSAPLGSLVARITDTPSRIFVVTAGLFAVALLSAAFLIPRVHGHTPHAGGKPDPEHRVILPVLFFFMAMSFTQTLGLQLMNGPLVFYLNQDLHLDPKHIGTPFIALAIIVAALAIPVGTWGGRWGRVKSVRLGLMFAAVGMFLLPMKPTIIWWLLVAVPMIIGFLLSIPAWLAILTELAPIAWRGRIYGYVATAQGLGAVMGPSLGTWLYGDKGHGAPFQVSGIILGLTLVASFFGLHEGMRAVKEAKVRR
ncbi:MAG TPA: MFS transporter [Armatimonadota bacterium]|jgi:MFS family permease